MKTSNRVILVTPVTDGFTLARGQLGVISDHVAGKAVFWLNDAAGGRVEEKLANVPNA